jgi:N-dimethylarginine dimethylaminohydrolase
MSRLVKITLGVACGLLTALCLSQLHPPHEREAMTPRLVSDADLALTEISVHYRSDFHDECIETLQDLLDGLPQEVTVRVVTESQAEFNFLKDRLARSATSPQLRAVITGMPITPWSKDRFGTMTAEGNPVLAIPRARTVSDGPRGNDEKSTALICREIDGVTLKVLPFMFEGGDLLSDRDNIYLPANMVARNEPLTDEGKENLLAAIGKTFGKKVVRIGDDARDMPDHHIGMYLTPLGNGRLAVADPDMGLQMCRELNNITKIAGVTVETDSACYKPFRNVIQLLQDQHIDFIRVPMILTTLPRVYATYNNAIVEERHGVRRIFMPTYGVPELDRRAAALFEEQGLQVIPVRVSKLFKHTGSLRCLVGVIRRS